MKELLLVLCVLQKINLFFRITHKGMKFQCSQEACLKKFSSRNKLKLHQKTTGHEGEGIFNYKYYVNHITCFRN